MSNRSISLTDPLYDYLLQVSLREAPLLKKLRDETAQMSNANMQIAPEQGQFMALLARLIGARHCIEVGTFTGYSSLAVALALPRTGRIICCDVSQEYTAVARRYWREAGVEDMIELRLGPAARTLESLVNGGGSAHYDFAFIDADKTNYAGYYELCLSLLRPGGLIAVDNTLWNGRVLDAKDQSEDTRAIRLFNEFVRDDDRVDVSLVPIGDGVTLARKKS